MNGKQRLGACGHIQRAVIGQLFLCVGSPECDGKQRCRRCASSHVEPFVAAPMCPPGSMHCVECGCVWFDPMAQVG